MNAAPFWSIFYKEKALLLFLFYNAETIYLS